MELCEFRGRIFGKHSKQLFTFESVWDSFRPIASVGWNGHEIVCVDAEYKKDFFSPVYGYGSPEMKEVCRHLTQNTELGDAKEIVDPLSFWRWCGISDAKWWNDRACVFSSKCIDTSKSSWKSYLNYIQSKPKTLRRSVVRRMTRKRV
jgi:hypothetical protein